MTRFRATARKRPRHTARAVTASPGAEGGWVAPGSGIGAHYMAGHGCGLPLGRLNWRHMEYRVLGGTGVKVSELCLGTMNWRWTTSEAMSYRVMDAFVDGGGTFLDSADIYSFWAKGCTGGSSEIIIGKWM